MNSRALYIALAVQALFAGALIFAGARARDARKMEYLELTHRATSGQASEDELAKLLALLPPNADAQAVRALLGMPVLVRANIELRMARDEPQAQALKGSFWIYYPAQPGQPPFHPAAAGKLSGPQRCLVLEFDDSGRAKGKWAWVSHPVKE